jgi:hypothetical protein
MSKLNLPQVANNIQNVLRPAMQEMAEASRNEFVNNFDTTSFDGVAWQPLKYRDEPPPKLDVTGQMKDNTRNSIKSVTSHRAVLENTSIDSRGRSYAAWHNTGNSVHPARPIMLHTEKLTKIHLAILSKWTGKAWQRV